MTDGAVPYPTLFVRENDDVQIGDKLYVPEYESPAEPELPRFPAPPFLPVKHVAHRQFAPKNVDEELYAKAPINPPLPPSAFQDMPSPPPPPGTVSKAVFVDHTAYTYIDAPDDPLVKPEPEEPAAPPDVQPLDSIEK